MTIKFNVDILEGSKVIVPVSMGSFLKGVKIKELLEALKERKCDITVLVADTLQKYNSDYESALKMGDDFLKENEEYLKGINVLRWHEYIASKKDLFQKYLKEVEAKAKEGSVFHTKMLRTQKKCLISKDIDSSLKYQKEEYAVILTLEGFDYLIYPKIPTDGILSLYDVFSKMKIPQYVHANFQNNNLKNMEHLGFHSQSKEKLRHRKSLHITFRMLLANFDSAIGSPELSSDAKELFLEEIDKRLQMYSRIYNQSPTSYSQLKVIS